MSFATGFAVQFAHVSIICGQPDNSGYSVGNDRQNGENQNSVMDLVYNGLLCIFEMG